MRHAATEFPAPEVTYLSPDAFGAPLVLLVDIGDPLPTAHGLWLTPGLGDECPGCGLGETDCSVEGSEGRDDSESWHLRCLLVGDHLGCLPTYAVTFVREDGTAVCTHGQGVCLSCQ